MDGAARGSEQREVRGGDDFTGYIAWCFCLILVGVSLGFLWFSSFVSEVGVDFCMALALQMAFLGGLSFLKGGSKKS